MKIKDHFLTGEIFEIRETETNDVLKTSPLPENMAAYYESKDYISHHQDSGSFKEKLYKFLQSFNLNYKRNILAKELPIGAKVLDYGCGAGEFLKFVEQDFQTYGYEPNESARVFASKKLIKTQLLSSLETVQDGSLDAITLWHVFEHIENQQDILSLFYNKLKSNGLLIIAVPNHTSDDAKRYREYWAAYDVPRHVFHFSRTGMENLMNNQNWKIKKIKPLLLDSFYISMLSEKYRKSPLFWLKGFIYGAISNFKASKNGQFSSLIYVIEKK
ncbi:class I SAM-dependent methyltransferase [Chryseobacterium sp.]|uniref:class I SAM-dependent methyltransferase n=1 Tax=Chryseobacterium sp. TaxID=1871047 RepID=UPI0011C86F3C|nr:class I SAM-dependent methyltransferase [Chryseobacterium sp.]TXF76017.1 class I SAM-dependent methyltransferase [Chryseobacterium sp.]